MLKTIAIITIAVSNLGSVEDAYQEHLGFQTVEGGTVNEELVELWQAPEMLEKDYVLMRPAKMAPMYLRFIEMETPESYAPMQTHGWNAFELVATNPDTLVTHLEGSPFEVLGPPRDLYPTGASPRVMQVRGPSNEIIYMTRPAGGGEVSQYADTFVGPSFIVVNGGPDISDMQNFYEHNFGMPVIPAQEYPITIISRLNDKPLDTTYPLSLVPLPNGSMIELDGYKPWSRPRETAAGLIPPGMSIVSFTADDLDLIKTSWVTEPRVIAAAPYNGRRAGLVLGAAGEWIEIIESDVVAVLPVEKETESVQIENND